MLLPRSHSNVVPELGWERLGGRPTGFPPDALSLQPVCKPGSGWHAGKPAYVTAIPLGHRLPGASSNLPGRPDLDRSQSHSALSRRTTSRRPYSVLLPVGFAVPPALPPARCALTAPFHPYRGNTQRAAAVCSLWHFPWARARRMLSGTVCPRSPDFPPRQPFGFAGATVRPTDTNTDGGTGCRRQEASLCDATTSGSKLMTRAAMVRGRLR